MYGCSSPPLPSPPDLRPVHVTDVVESKALLSVVAPRDPLIIGPQKLMVARLVSTRPSLYDTDPDGDVGDVRI